MTDEQIVYWIDELTKKIVDRRCELTALYRKRRELRKQLEQNHRNAFKNLFKD